MSNKNITESDLLNKGLFKQRDGTYSKRNPNKNHDNKLLSENMELIAKEKQVKRKRYLEDDLQQDIVKNIRLLYPDAILYAIPNGGRRNAFEGQRLKKQGVMAGVSDLHLIYKRKIFFIEVKAGKGKQSESQKLFQRDVEERGFEYWTVYSTMELINKIKNSF